MVTLDSSQLAKSRYKKQIEPLNVSNAASGTSFSSIEELKQGLFRLDIIRGLPYGGAATKSSPTTVATPSPGNGHSKYKSKPNGKNEGLVSSVNGTDLEMHALP